MEISKFKSVALAVGKQGGLSRVSVAKLFKSGIDKAILPATDATDAEIAYVSRWMAGYQKPTNGAVATAKPTAKRSKRGKRGKK